MSAPFHCSLMKPAEKIMEQKIYNTLFNQPKIKIINNVNASETTNVTEIKKLLVDQIFSAVKWRDIIINMSKSGIENFIEIGPGKALTGMVKRTVKEKVNCFSINSIADIKKAINEFKNKKVLITGATGGIGNSIVKKFYDLEAKILATGTNDQKLDSLKKNIQIFLLKNFN